MAALREAERQNVEERRRVRDLCGYFSKRLAELEKIVEEVGDNQMFSSLTLFSEDSGPLSKMLYEKFLHETSQGGHRNIYHVFIEGERHHFFRDHLCPQI